MSRGPVTGTARSGGWWLGGLLALALVGGCATTSRPVPLETLRASTLPVFVIETGGRAIPTEPKVPARLRVVEAGYGTGAPEVGYDGPIGVERRGQSSLTKYPKPQFGLELRDADGDGEGRDVALLGMPEDDDWVLHGPYGDKALIRNALAYRLARETGRYAPRTRFCEVVVDGEYLGLYVLTERIERGDDRVDVRRLRARDRGPEEITGGYIFSLDKNKPGGWLSSAPAANGRRPEYTPRDPGPEELSPAQRLYLQSAVTAFEETMASDEWADPEHGYAAHLDVGSFVDYLLLTELSRNVDGYRISAYFYKDHARDGGQIHAGPAWDFDIAFGNADYYGGDVVEGWQADLVPGGHDHPVPSFWPRLLREERFRARLSERWAELRAGPFHPRALDATVDALVAELGDAPARNFEKWDVLGRRVWPNPTVETSHAEAVETLRQWLRVRAAWMDRELATGA